jgi:hypothetical protein
MSQGGLTRRVRSMTRLGELLDEIEAGREPKPEWIELAGEIRLDRLPEDELAAWVARLHRGVQRGFKARKSRPPKGPRRLAFWRTLAGGGFHDFSDAGWTKCWSSPWPEDYDYVAGYLEAGLGGLDPFKVYTAVLGTHDYGVEDFVGTRLCSRVGTVVEPMAGSAEFAWHGHFRFPEIHYVMFDLDPSARDHVQGRRWLPDVEQQYLIGNVLDEGTWKQVQSLTTGESLSYIGKQSHHFLAAKEVMHLLDLGTRYVDWFMLEVPEPSLMQDLDPEEELTRPEMKDAGFRAGLVDDPGVSPNILTNHMSFSLQVWDDHDRRTLFRYTNWTSWQAPTLVALSRLLDIRCWFFHADDEEFWPVEDAATAGETAENVNFLVFTRRDGTPDSR